MQAKVTRDGDILLIHASSMSLLLQLHGRSIRGVQSTYSCEGCADHGPLTIGGTENGLVGFSASARHNSQPREFLSVPKRRIQYSFMSGTVP